MQSIKSKLREFKLSGIYNNLEERLSYAQAQSLSYHDFLELLLEDELNNRKDNGYKKRYAKAKFPSYKTVEDFDFNYQPSIDKRLFNDVLSCQFVKEKRNVVFIGNPGTGKTHLSTAIGIRAVAKGFKVFFTSVSEMIYSLHASKADNSYYKKLETYMAPDLLILDELGFKKLPSFSADDFFEVIAKRYEKGSLVITTNKQFEQWSDIFADNIMANAILDRVVHHSTVFNINGQSYRTKNIKSHKEVSSI
ncbi:MAG TPA: AAA family ATPase [Candidatus Omnitrophica bacterium]|nr:AAA family ATPase [Candidatus Omnitrophota bacterium]